jgi:hypothetical protein
VTSGDALDVDRFCRDGNARVKFTGHCHINKAAAMGFVWQAQDRRNPADNSLQLFNAYKGTRAIMDMGGVNIGGLVDVSKAISTPGAGPISSNGQLAALKARLKVLFKAVDGAGLDTSMDAKSRKMLMQSLQAEIQMVMQRIADLETADKRKGSPIEAVAEAAAEEKDKPAHPAKPKNDLSDLLQNILSHNKIDISV